MFTTIIMVALSLLGPKINEKAFHNDPAMYKMDKGSVVLIVTILLILSALYVKFW